METERFAPSPTGRLHLGHAYSAIRAHDAARATGGRFLLRFEDLDAGRVRAPHYAAIEDDLRWLGLTWDETPWRQSTRTAVYEAALRRLEAAGLIYPCACTRADIAAAVAAPQEGAAAAVYPGSCRDRSVPPAGPTALRLDLGRALALAGAEALAWRELEDAPGMRPLDAGAMMAQIGDVVLRRKDGVAAYHLAVVVDDAAQGVTTVTRGADLAPVTPLHRLLQALLGLPVPRWRHHRLIRDETGRRLAKRDDARALATLRAEGVDPAAIRRIVGL